MPERFQPEAFVEAAPWRFAKTMPQIPHYYVVRGWVPDEEFDAMVRHIEDHGYRGRWRRYVRTYLELGEWRYWVIEPVINREQLPGEEVVRI